MFRAGLRQSSRLQRIKSRLPVLGVAFTVRVFHWVIRIAGGLDAHLGERTCPSTAVSGEQCGHDLIVITQDHPCRGLRSDGRWIKRARGLLEELAMRGIAKVEVGVSLLAAEVE